MSFFFPWLRFKNEKHLSEDLGLSSREINSLSFASSGANLDFSIWIPPIQEAVPPVSVLDILQSAPMLWATVSIASPRILSLVKLSFPYYLRLGCRLESEMIKKPNSLFSVQDHKPWTGRSRIPLLEVLKLPGASMSAACLFRWGGMNSQLWPRAHSYCTPCRCKWELQIETFSSLRDVLTKQSFLSSRTKTRTF